MNTFTLADPTTLKVLFANVPRTDVRFFLQGMLIDPTGYLVATDGHAMAEYSDPVLQAEPFQTAVRDWCTRNKRENLIIRPWKIAARGDVSLEIQDKDIFAVQGSTRTLLDTSPSEEKYPDWRRVSKWTYACENWRQGEPSEIDIREIGVDPHLLIRFAPKKEDFLKVEFDSPTAAFRVSCPNHEVRGTVMPARI